MTCSLCQRPIENLFDAYTRVTGWEHKARGASRRGGSDIVLREHLPELACSECITRLQSGLDVRQGVLV